MEEKMHWVPTAIGMVVLAFIFGGLSLAIYPGLDVVWVFLVKIWRMKWDSFPAWVQAVGSIVAIFGASWASMKAIKYEFLQKERSQIDEAAIIGISLVSGLTDAAESLAKFKGRHFPMPEDSVSCFVSNLEVVMLRGSLPEQDFCIKMAHVDANFARSMAIALESRKQLKKRIEREKDNPCQFSSEDEAILVLCGFYIDHVITASSDLILFLEKQGMSIEKKSNNRLTRIS